MTQLALSIEEAAKSIGCGRTKIYHAINSGALKARKFGKRSIILQSDLESFLANLEAYLPIFERLDFEVEKLQAKERAMEKVRMIASAYQEPPASTSRT